MTAADLTGRQQAVCVRTGRRIQGIPVWVFHGDADKTVPVEESRRLVAALKIVGADVHYTEYPGVDHGETPRRAWRETMLTDWLFAQRRSDLDRERSR